MYTVMTVCTGNICRSPMAEIILRTEFERRGLADKVNVESSGVSDEEYGNPIDRRAVKVLRERGYELPAHHFAHRITRDEIERTDLSLCPIADKMLRAYKGMYCMESFNPLGVQRYRKNHPELARGQLSDAFLKEGEYVGVLYFILQNLLLNFVTKPDFVAYNHHYPEILSRKLCRGLYHNTAAAWTIKSQQELDEARKHFDIFIFDSFVPEARK